jgi:hypothetical protein
MEGARGSSAGLLWKPKHLEQLTSHHPSSSSVFPSDTAYFFCIVIIIDVPSHDLGWSGGTTMVMLLRHKESH